MRSKGRRRRREREPDFCWGEEKNQGREKTPELWGLAKWLKTKLGERTKDEIMVKLWECPDQNMTAAQSCGKEWAATSDAQDEVTFNQEGSLRQPIVESRQQKCAMSCVLI